MKTFFSNLTFGKKLLLLLTPIISTLISMKAAILGLWILIIIDLLTGIRKNLYMRGVPFNPLKKAFWKSIKSYLLRQTWKKTYEYAIGIITIVVIESLIFGGVPVTLMGKIFSIAELSILIPATVEVWSIFENLEAVSGKNILKVLKNFLPTPIAALFNSGKTKEVNEVLESLETTPKETQEKN